MEVSPVAPLLKIPLSPVREEYGPRALEVGTGFVECWRRTAGAFPRMTARIEAAVPLPGIGMDGISDTYGNGADVHVAVINVPAIGTLGITAAGECGHSLTTSSGKGCDCRRRTASRYRLRLEPGSDATGQRIHVWLNKRCHSPARSANTRPNCSIMPAVATRIRTKRSTPSPPISASAARPSTGSPRLGAGSCARIDRRVTCRRP
jgi:hypothetical protein